MVTSDTRRENRYDNKLESRRWNGNDGILIRRGIKYRDDTN
jgi:hypothetical protein